MTLKTYKEINAEIKKYETSKKNSITTMIFSVLFAIFIISIPTIILINLLIFKDYVRLIVVGFGILAILLCFLIEFFYNLGITEGKIKKIYIISLFHSIFTTIFVFIIILIIFLIGVI